MSVRRRRPADPDCECMDLQQPDLLPPPWDSLENVEVTNWLLARLLIFLEKVRDEIYWIRQELGTAPCSGGMIRV